MANAFQYVMQNHGLDSDAAYPYIGKVGQCLSLHGKSPILKPVKAFINSPAQHFQRDKCKYSSLYRAANCTGYGFLPKGDEFALKVGLAIIGPIAVAIDASRLKFLFYRHGKDKWFHTS